MSCFHRHKLCPKCKIKLFCSRCLSQVWFKNRRAKCRQQQKAHEQKKQRNTSPSVSRPSTPATNNAINSICLSNSSGGSNSTPNGGGSVNSGSCGSPLSSAGVEGGVPSPKNSKKNKSPLPHFPISPNSSAYYKLPCSMLQPFSSSGGFATSVSAFGTTSIWNPMAAAPGVSPVTDFLGNSPYMPMTMTQPYNQVALSHVPANSQIPVYGQSIHGYSSSQKSASYHHYGHIDYLNNMQVPTLPSATCSSNHSSVCCYSQHGPVIGQQLNNISPYGTLSTNTANMTADRHVIVNEEYLENYDVNKQTSFWNSKFQTL